MHKKITYAAFDNKPRYFKFSVTFLPDSFCLVIVWFNEDFFSFTKGNSFTKEILPYKPAYFIFANWAELCSH